MFVVYGWLQFKAVVISVTFIDVFPFFTFPNLLQYALFLNYLSASLLPLSFNLLLLKCLFDAFSR